MGLRAVFGDPVFDHLRSFRWFPACSLLRCGGAADNGPPLVGGGFAGPLAARSCAAHPGWPCAAALSCLALVVDGRPIGFQTRRISSGDAPSFTRRADARLRLSAEPRPAAPRDQAGGRRNPARLLLDLWQI